MCCDFHVGEDYDNELQKCNMQCEKIILGDLKPLDKVKELPKTDLKESRKLKEDVLKRKSRNPSKHPHTHIKKKLSSRRKKLRTNTSKTPKFEKQQTSPLNKQIKVPHMEKNNVNQNELAVANKKMKNFFKSE
jgi:hypothetical protein